MSAIQIIMPKMEFFQKRLKAAKEDMHVTNQQFADDCGVSFSTVSKILAGNRYDPKFSDGVAMCMTAGLSVDDIFGLSKPTDSPDAMQKRIHELELENVHLAGEVDKLQAVNKVQAEQVKARRPLVYVLLGLCAILALLLIAYLSVDAQIVDAGLIQRGDLSTAAWAIVGIVALSFGVMAWAFIHTTRKK